LVSPSLLGGAESAESAESPPIYDNTAPPAYLSALPALPACHGEPGSVRSSPPNPIPSLDAWKDLDLPVPLRRASVKELTTSVYGNAPALCPPGDSLDDLR
jgi:hypothetical protein